MDQARRIRWVYAFLGAAWVLVAVWQAEEHYRFREAAKADLSNRSKDIANTVSACIRGMRFRGVVPGDRLVPVLNELVNGRTNDLVKSSELTSIVLLNAAGDTIAEAGRRIDPEQKDLLQQGEHWGQRNVTFVNPVDLGATTTWEGGTNPTVVLPPMRDLTNRFPEGIRNRPAPGREPGPEHPPREGPPADGPGGGLAGAPNSPASNIASRSGGEGRPPEGGGRPRRPPWLRGLSESDYQSLVQKNTLHDLVLAMSIESFQAASTRDLWLRLIIVFLAAVSALGSGVAWRNLVTSSDLQIRLVRASEMNTHLKEMNLAAAGLAHETRNPLNIIRGLAQMISKQPEAAAEICKRSSEIIDEADKVAAQLNEFINYSRPREVRRSAVALGSVINEVVRALGYDLQEKNIRLKILGEQLAIEADEQMLRQALFNLLINAVQAADKTGEIQVVVEQLNGGEAALEVRDDGPGVPPERRTEIFKPYFTTQKTGTGLGLAVVQQIVLAHGWEIACAANQPKGARFRISHLKVSPQSSTSRLA